MENNDMSVGGGMPPQEEHQKHIIGYIVVLVVIIAVGWFIFASRGEESILPGGENTGSENGGTENGIEAEDKLSKGELLEMVTEVEASGTPFSDEEKARIFRTIGGSGFNDLGVSDEERTRIIEALRLK